MPREISNNIVHSRNVRKRTGLWSVGISLHATQGEFCKNYQSEAAARAVFEQLMKKWPRNLYTLTLWDGAYLERMAISS